ncbi:hypothetical protein TNCV_1442091 [Trichonephila clavipes]|uniref:Uncharacterized protein n=1 Tax=Trichonephila clavipes TaxID=2585209 RepID=A0A8X6RLR7_TRICX|nr:hypothetical protein TNCV_1442091 [Trichonephila clavipes]
MKFHRCSVGLGSGLFARPGIVVKPSQDIKSSLSDMLPGNVLLKYRVGCSLQQGLKNKLHNLCKRLTGQRGRSPTTKNCALQSTAVCGSGERQPPEVQ